MARTMLPPPADIAPPGIGGTVTSPVVHTEATRTVVTLRGETDLSTRPALADALSRVIATGNGDVVVDLAAVTFIDTAIVRSLATGQRLLDRTGRTLTFRSPSRLAVRVLDMFGLTELIEPAPGPAVPPHPLARQR
jgi:anti-sigma B factor antagonist